MRDAFSTQPFWPSSPPHSAPQECTIPDKVVKVDLFLGRFDAVGETTSSTVPLEAQTYILFGRIHLQTGKPFSLQWNSWCLLPPLPPYPVLFVHFFFFFFFFSLFSMSLAENSGHNSHKSSTTLSYQWVQHFHVSKQGYGRQCLGFLTCAQMLMHVIVNCTHGLYRHRKSVCTGNWLWEKNPFPHWRLEPASVLQLAFQSDTIPTELSWPLAQFHFRWQRRQRWVPGLWLASSVAMTAVQFRERNNYFSISVLFCHACHHLCANNSKITQVLQHAMRVRG